MASHSFVQPSTTVTNSQQQEQAPIALEPEQTRVQAYPGLKRAYDTQIGWVKRV